MSWLNADENNESMQNGKALWIILSILGLGLVSWLSHRAAKKNDPFR